MVASGVNVTTFERDNVLLVKHVNWEAWYLFTQRDQSGIPTPELYLRTVGRIAPQGENAR